MKIAAAKTTLKPVGVAPAARVPAAPKSPAPAGRVSSAPKTPPAVNYSRSVGLADARKTIPRNPMGAAAKR